MKTPINTNNWIKGFEVPAKREKEAAWNLLQEKLTTAPQKKIIPFYKRKSIVFAASFLLVAVLFTFITDSLFTSKKYYTTTGEQQVVELPDQSKITLNPLSECVVNYSFITGERNVKLSGEALFDIRPGKKFEVKFTGGKVQVLGTVFLVSAYKNSVSNINCISGSVAVKSGKEVAVLKPSTGVILDKKKELVPEKIENRKVLDEMKGNYNWQNEPLYKIFEKLENRFGYKIKTSDEIKMRKFSGQIKMVDLQKTCEIVSFAMDLQFEVDDKTKSVVFENSF